MPYKSEAQRRFFNSPAGKAKIGKEEVEHWNEVSKGKKLPVKLDDAIDACDGELPGQISMFEDIPEASKQSHREKKNKGLNKPSMKLYNVSYNVNFSDYRQNDLVPAYSDKQAISYLSLQLRKKGVKAFNMKAEEVK